MGTAVGNHLEKTAAGVVILVVLLEVLGQFVDFAAKECDLNIRRTGVSVVAGRVLNNGRLYALG